MIQRDFHFGHDVLLQPYSLGSSCQPQNHLEQTLLFLIITDYHYVQCQGLVGIIDLKGHTSPSANQHTMLSSYSVHVVSVLLNTLTDLFHRLRRPT